MSLKHACFVSYRHPGHPGATRLIEAFCDCLQEQLAYRLPVQQGGVFLDKDRLRGGDLVDPTLAYELCASGCLILLFTPHYFDRNHPYCTREYQGMRRLEDRRRGRLPADLQNVGLVIPIVIRGAVDVPMELKQRMPVDLEPHLLCPADFGTKRVRQVVDQVAFDVHRRFRILCEHPELVASECNGFRLPDEADVLPWLDGLSTKHPVPPLPGRRP